MSSHLPKDFRWRLKIVAIWAAGMLLLTALGYWVIGPLISPIGPVAELISAYQGSLQSDQQLEITSTDAKTVQAWLSERVGFVPPVVAWEKGKFRLVGGRQGQIAGRKAAIVVYHYEKHVIDLFIWPGTQPGRGESRPGVNLMRFEYNGQICWAVSDADLPTLEQFAEDFLTRANATTRP